VDQTRWEAAFAHRDRLLRIARSRGVSGEDAEDVVQEAFARCAEFETLDAERLGPFLTTVTIRLCADVHRRNEEPVRARRWLVPLLHDEPDPADVVCRDHGPEWVASLVERLPERQRRVLFDRARGMSIDQIAKRHRLTYKAVESALSRARTTLKSAVAATSSVVVCVARRFRPRGAAIATSATALVVTAVVMTMSPHSDPVHQMPRAATIVGDDRGAPSRPAVHVTPPAPAPGTAGSTRALPPRGYGQRSTARKATTTHPEPVPTFSVEAAGVHVEHAPDGYDPGERVVHCVKYGFTVYPVLQCRYPPDGAIS